MKIYKAKTRYFTQEDMNGWIHILTQGQPLKNDKEIQFPGGHSRSLAEW